MENALIVLVVVVVGLALFMPRLSTSPGWRAAITPLASIIGSGFLVLGPILDASYGGYAPLVMAALCALAYAFGGALRYNIRRLAATADRTASERHLETAASWALAFAYIISVAYYLNLLGAFAVSLTPFGSIFSGKLVTSGVFVLILIVGWVRGFSALEWLEQVSVNVKLSIIAGLFVGLGWYFTQTTAAGGLVWNPPAVTGWPAITLAAGLIVTVQGFETSRYLGEEYDAEARIRSMKLAQGVSTTIYILYILLLSYLFMPDRFHLSETAIIDMMAVVAPVLPALLVAAAIAAQFSAAVADTGGSGGLIAELTGGRLSPRAGYALLVAVGLALTWTLSVFEIISYASRAFAFYYGIQAMIAALGARAGGKRPAAVAGFFGLGLAGFAIAVFGTPTE